MSAPLIIGLIIAALVVAGLLLVMFAAFIVGARADERDEMAGVEEGYGDWPSPVKGRGE